jgi:hypothetical protein
MKEKEMIRVVESKMNVSLVLKNVSRIRGVPYTNTIWVDVNGKEGCRSYGFVGYEGIVIYRSLKKLCEYITFRPVDYGKVFAGFFEFKGTFHVSNIKYLFLDQENKNIMVVIGK